MNEAGQQREAERREENKISDNVREVVSVFLWFSF